MPAQPWTLDRIITKVKNDLQLHSEDLVTTDDMIQMVEDAVTDGEEIVIDAFSDFTLCYRDLSVTAGDTVIDLPEDIYEFRIRKFRYAQQGFDNPAGPGETYKITKLDLDDDSGQTGSDWYQYRLVNDRTNGMQLKIEPPIRETSAIQFRLWYIRQFKRLVNMTDTLEVGLRPQYVISHVKCACMVEDADPMLDAETAKLNKQEDKMKNSVSRLTDDDEDALLQPDENSLSEAYDYGDY